MKKSSVLPALAVMIVILTITLGTGCGNDHAAANSAQQTKVAFRSGRAIGDVTGEPYIMNRNDGSGVTPIPYSNMPAKPRGVTVSPDDSKLLAEISGSPTQVFTAKLDGTALTPLTSLGGRFPRWSPDGKQIVFASLRDASGGWKVYLMNADGSGQTRLSPLDNDVNDVGPSFSPDGKHIVFMGWDANTRQIAIWTMNTDGSDRKSVIFPSSNAFTPAFSPDGSKILWVDNYEIASANLDGSGKTTLTSSGGKIYELMVLGTEVWFTTSQDGNPEIYRLDGLYKVSGGSPVQKNMTNDPHADSIDMYVP